jgi:TonB family protein
MKIKRLFLFIFFAMIWIFFILLFFSEHQISPHRLLFISFAIFFASWIFFNLLFFSKLLSLHKEIVETKEETAYTIQIRETVRFDESSPPPPALTQTVFELYELDEPPQPIVQVQPEYPEKAKKAKLEGRVIVVAVVDENGDVIQASIHSSTNPIFNEAALEAAKKMKFKPGRQKDIPVKVKVLIPFAFKLTK